MSNLVELRSTFSALFVKNKRTLRLKAGFLQKKSKQAYTKGNYQGVRDHETENQEKNRGRDHLRPGTFEADGAQAGDLLQDRRSHD